MLLEKHRKSKNTIIKKLERLAEHSESLGMEYLAQDIRHGRITKLANERFHLVVLGEFNHGKSTFVNALLGTELLPTGITPTTAAINHVAYAEEPAARVLTLDGEHIELPSMNVDEWVTVAGEHHERVKRVEIDYPAEILKENITLVDTPGVNDLNEQRADITYGYVPRADAVIFLLDAAQALKDSEREFLSSHVLEGSKERLIFVLGKMDLLTPAEQAAVTTYVREGLAQFVPNPVVFPLSAKAWLDSRDPESGFPQLLEYLDRFLDTDRGRIIVDNAATDAERTAALIQQNLGIKLHALGLDIDELETRVEEVRKQLHASKRQIDELHLRIKADTEAIKSQVRMALTEFTQRFAKTIPHEIDRVDADDLKRYLGPFVQDKFKEWSEFEGMRVSSFLEKMAEEVIAVTNENVAAAFQSLSSRLGPAETQVQIDTDSFKYDLGIYAVGALGTTVFLFVNSLAGGLLTLAAPVLAIIVKSKVSGDIKEQAKERAPGVIIKAGDAMGPYFDECIDDFSKRLRDFVTGAGVNLYRGITEVLDKTIEERHQGHDSIAPLVKQVQEQSLDVVQIREALTRVRQTIWSDEERLPPGMVGATTTAAPDPEAPIEPELVDSASIPEAEDVIDPADIIEEEESEPPPPPPRKTPKDLN